MPSSCKDNTQARTNLPRGLSENNLGGDQQISTNHQAVPGVSWSRLWPWDVLGWKLPWTNVNISSWAHATAACSLQLLWWCLPRRWKRDVLFGGVFHVFTDVAMRKHWISIWTICYLIDRLMINHEILKSLSQSITKQRTRKTWGETWHHSMWWNTNWSNPLRGFDIYIYISTICLIQAIIDNNSWFWYEGFDSVQINKADNVGCSGLASTKKVSVRPTVETTVPHVDLRKMRTIWTSQDNRHAKQSTKIWELVKTYDITIFFAEYATISKLLWGTRTIKGFQAFDPDSRQKGKFLYTLTLRLCPIIVLLPMALLPFLLGGIDLQRKLKWLDPGDVGKNHRLDIRRPDFHSFLASHDV